MCIIMILDLCLSGLYCWIFDSPTFCEQAARYDDIDDLMSIAAAGVSLDSKDSEGRTGYCRSSSYFLALINDTI